MKIKIRKNKHKCSFSDIERLEKLFGYPFPKDYIDFLIEFNGGRPETNIFSISEEDNESGINKFFSQEEIISEKKLLGTRLANGVVPIAELECGNLLCISLVEGQTGIYFWDHEIEDKEWNLPSWRNMFYIARSFDVFLNNVKKFDPSKIKLSPGTEVVWADTEFLKQIKRDQEKRDCPHQ